jgi:hypothetical protein
MKNLVLYASILAGVLFVACASDEDNVPVPIYIGCATCEIPQTGPSQIEEQPYEVCVDEAGIAYVDNAYTGIEAGYYFQLYCANELELPLPPSQFDNDTIGRCRTCDAYTVMGMEEPQEEVCKGEDGNAIINGVPSGFPYVTYLVATSMVTDCN